MKPAIPYQGNYITGDSQDEPSKSALTVLAICECSNNVGHQLLYVN